MPSKQAGPITDHFICTDCEWSKAGTHVGSCPECHAAVINGVRTWGQLERLLLAREQRVIGPAEAAILDWIAERSDGWWDDQRGTYVTELADLVLDARRKGGDT